MQLVGIQIYNLDIARIKNQRNETDTDTETLEAMNFALVCDVTACC